MATTMHSAEIIHRLRERYPLGDGWIGLAECTPPKTDRRFDFLAIMGWGSRGHVAMGFEVKVARSDWLRELNEPAKAEPLVRLCTHWWICAPPGVVKREELPPAWGLLEFHPQQVRTAKQAPVQRPDAWDDAMWRCVLLRCATRAARTPEDIAAARNAGYEEGHRAGVAAVQGEGAQLRRQAECDREAIEGAEKATGVRLSAWIDFPLLGRAMALCQSAGFAERLKHESEQLRGIADTLDQAVAHLESARQVSG